MMNRELKTDMVQSTAVLGSQELTSCQSQSEKVKASVLVTEPPSCSGMKFPLYHHVTSLLWLDYRL